MESLQINCDRQENGCEDSLVNNNYIKSKELYENSLDINEGKFDILKNENDLENIMNQYDIEKFANVIFIYLVSNSLN